MNVLFNRYCLNIRGKLKIRNEYEGTIMQVIPQIRQMFQRIPCDDIKEADDTRFKYFTEKLLPQLQNAISNSHILVFIPSYFDYVRIRNYFRKNEILHCLCCEYTSVGNVTRARAKFFHGQAKFMLATERFHYFHRYKLRGIQNLVFYALPENAHFYPEILNIVENTSNSCYVLYTKFDLLKMERVVGTKRCKKMLESDRATHLFVSEK